MTTYRLASPLAMLAAASAGALSITLLIEQIGAQPVTIALSIGLVALTIATGVLAHGQGILTAAGALLGLLSLMGSALIVWEQSGRRAQMRDETSAKVEDISQLRRQLLKKRAQAEEILNMHRTSQATECASGRGKKCDGVSYTVSTWEAAVKGYEAQLRGIPVSVPDAKVTRVSTIARLLGYSEASAGTWVGLLDPIALPVWLEWVSVLCAILALEPASRGVAALASRPTIASNTAALQKAYSNAGTPVIPATPPAVLVASDEQRVVEALKRKGGSVGSQRHLSIVLGVSPAETCRMLQRCHPNRVERIWDPIAKSNVIRIKDAA